MIFIVSLFSLVYSLQEAEELTLEQIKARRQPNA